MAKKKKIHIKGEINLVKASKKLARESFGRCGRAQTFKSKKDYSRKGREAEREKKERGDY